MRLIWLIQSIFSLVWRSQVTFLVVYLIYPWHPIGRNFNASAFLDHFHQYLEQAIHFRTRFGVEFPTVGLATGIIGKDSALDH